MSLLAGGGTGVGVAVGRCVGRVVGRGVGRGVGAAVGRAVGRAVAWADGVAIADGGGVRTGDAAGADAVGHGLAAADGARVADGVVAIALGDEAGEMEPSAAGPHPTRTSAAASVSLPMQPRITERRSVI